MAYPVEGLAVHWLQMLQKTANLQHEKLYTLQFDQFCSPNSFYLWVPHLLTERVSVTHFRISHGTNSPICHLSPRCRDAGCCDARLGLLSPICLPDDSTPDAVTCGLAPGLSPICLPDARCLHAGCCGPVWVCCSTNSYLSLRQRQEKKLGPAHTQFNTQFNAY